MNRADIVKDLRARGWHGPVTREIAADHGYTPSGPDYEWLTPEPAVGPPKPAAPVGPIVVVSTPADKAADKPIPAAKPAAPAAVMAPAK